MSAALRAHSRRTEVGDLGLGQGRAEVAAEIAGRPGSAENRPGLGPIETRETPGVGGSEERRSPLDVGDQGLEAVYREVTAR